MIERLEKEYLISAGIDIGTATTKLVISRFAICNTAGASRVPRIEIVDVEVLYKSPIYDTPLLNTNLIDIDKVKSIVTEEYLKAGIQPSQIQTGAVIITGETATKQNATEMVHSLSSSAGDFLVATAGPDLEGIIAAKGSGAYQFSKDTGKTIANIDIGGGTANIAVYQAGIFQGTCTLHIGGRLIEWRENKIKKLSKPIADIAVKENISLGIGDELHPVTLTRLTQKMVEAVYGALTSNISANHPLLLGHVPNWEIDIDAIMFSGGVSAYLYHSPELMQKRNRCEDIGEVLAQQLKASPLLQTFEWIKPKETVRATVLGAGTQTTDISGATIQVNDYILPLRNLPVFHLTFGYTLAHSNRVIYQSIKSGIELYDSLTEGIPFALYIKELPLIKFSQLQNLAEEFIEVYESLVKSSIPIVLILESDYAKALGQTLQSKQNKRQIICIDQIFVKEGDYIDIGKMLKSEVVPVIVKTLAFHS
ncbi:ethanolamine ammonia-lyase reactivating factor EutA [Alkalihalobacterium elongatum]|uniref:ethanolamine ammonia-lyase reactivating factor EutA n=1 Tax=Alkalihalobacterium elongatum TaxID=2675466 RepID=UPI001C1FB777|nr:ethanolamine ammonia-lyase reactivating factor EutA [Alkalihalobacterium elongatum]